MLNLLQKQQSNYTNDGDQLALMLRESESLPKEVCRLVNERIKWRSTEVRCRTRQSLHLTYGRSITTETEEAIRWNSLSDMTFVD